MSRSKNKNRNRNKKKDNTVKNQETSVPESQPMVRRDDLKPGTETTASKPTEASDVTAAATTGGAKTASVVAKTGKATAAGAAIAANGFMDKLKAILAQPNDSTKKTLAVALIMCLACSVIVSGAAVFLRPMQESNAALDRKRNILNVAGLLVPGEDIEKAFSNVQRRIVDLETGEFSDEFAGVEYDQYAASRDPALSIEIPSGEDIAGIGRRARYAEVYLVGNEEDFTQIILPVHGKGLWSTLYGFVSLKRDLNTIAGLTFYDHAETPGLGGEISNPVWQAKWDGKQAYNESGEVKLQVIKGVVESNTPEAEFKVDGLAGATLTSRGVSQLMRFWLDEQGFGPFLNNLRQQGA